MTLDKEQLTKFVNQTWETSILPALSHYITLPNISPIFDKNWVKNGYIEAAVEWVVNWCRAQDLKGISLTVERLENRTPLIFIDIAGSGSQTASTVLLYGHLDKQPEMTGWDNDKGPWQPVLKDNKLYGRGAADDGYAVFTALSAIKALQVQGVSHPRCVLVIESCEEGGSHDLPYYFELLQNRLGTPDLIICLDSGCGNYNQLWLTTSLRGTAVGELSVELLREGIHSGNGGGIVASSFRVLRSLLDRLEDAETGTIHIKEIGEQIPEIRKNQARTAASILGDSIRASYPLIEHVDPVSLDPYELILNRTWRPSLSYIGADGFPKPESAGNVLRPITRLMLSLRIPPTADSKRVATAMKQLLETNPPYNARVKFSVRGTSNGWNAPHTELWYEKALNQASLDFFGREPAFMGEGGSIPFMNLLATKFPKAQFMITGVLGPFSNAHGPNEFLHLPTAKTITCCVSAVLAELARQ